MVWQANVDFPVSGQNSNVSWCSSVTVAIVPGPPSTPVFLWHGIRRTCFFLKKQEAVYSSTAAANILEQSLPTVNLPVFISSLSPMPYVAAHTIVETENK